ncbi:EKA-like protein [Blumeria hordei DH14]|uniref:EKA-like protein n=1 Tax=Blumeria graminis f. sp. hordei (strain DH14) TaxID=546991 RepID=N1JFZ1_BLUG1|nr:EKA-like protein [Blumeria hordei DH14]
MKESLPKAATKAECPPELRPIVEAERRAAKTAANLTLCSAAIFGVEATLFPLTNGTNKLFVDSMRVYLRAIFAQCMATGPASTPPVLARRTLRELPKPGAQKYLPSQCSSQKSLGLRYPEMDCDRKQS